MTDAMDVIVPVPDDLPAPLLDKGKGRQLDNMPTAGRASFGRMPAEVVQLIGFYCALSTHNGDVQNVTSSGPSPSSHKLSSKMAAFGLQAAQAGEDDALPYDAPPAFATPPTNLRNLLMTCRQMHAALDAEANPALYGRVFRTKFDVEAIERRFGREAIAYNALAKELERRCICLKRIRRAVKRGQLLAEGQTTEQGEREIQDNLWLIYMMVTEDEGLNAAQLRWAQVDRYLRLFRRQDLVAELMQSGYPANTVQRALVIHLDYMLTDPKRLAAAADDHGDEMLFLLRPFVFAAHRFDAYLAPWTARRVPMAATTRPAARSAAPFDAPFSTPLNAFVADLSPRNQSQTMFYAGQTIEIRAPNVTHAAICAFFSRVEHDPSVSRLNPLMEQSNQLGNEREDDSPAGSDSEEDEDQDSRQRGGQRGSHRHPGARNPLLLQSRDYDADFARLLLCANPLQSRGMGLKALLGTFAGSWEGRFAFFDFDSYRDMLGGKVRSLYEGPFGEQPQVWKVQEHVVRLAEGEMAGGTGSVLNAGFHDDELEPHRRASLTEMEVEALRRGTPHRSLTGQEVSTADQDDQRYEILLSGTGHSAWGQFILRGRVRCWDGMVSMVKEYRQDGRGRWLYRGYVMAGNKLVGRWRDTFTPETMNGYEGCFLLHRRGS